MDEKAQHVSALLQATLSANALDRQLAECILQTLDFEPGHPTCLLQLAASAGFDQSVPSHVRQSAAVYLKNLIRRCWSLTCREETLDGHTGITSHHGSVVQNNSNSHTQNSKIVKCEACAKNRALMVYLQQIQADPAQQQLFNTLGPTQYFKSQLHQQQQNPNHAHIPASMSPIQHGHALDDHEKVQIRESLLEALVMADAPQGLQIAEIIKKVIQTDFPSLWQSLLPTALSFLASKDERRVLAALLTLRLVAKVYEFSHLKRNHGTNMATPTSVEYPTTDQIPASLDKKNNKRDSIGNELKPIDILVDNTFPILLDALTQFDVEVAAMTDPNFVPDQNKLQIYHSLLNTAPAKGARHPLDIPQIKQKLICKVFWSSTQMNLPRFILREQHAFQQWLTLFLTIFSRPVRMDGPFAIPNLDLDNPDKNELASLASWKVKKWIGHIFHRFFQRYGDPKRIPDDDPDIARAFAASFRDHCAAPIANTLLQVLFKFKQNNGFVAPRVANLAINYLEAALAPAVTFQVLKPHMELFLTQIIFPYMCITEEDLSLWDEDPQEYVRKSYDIMEDFYSPKSAACSFLFSLASLRSKTTLMPFLKFLYQILQQFHAAQPGSQEQAFLARQKDGVFLALGNIKSKFGQRPDLQNDLRNIMEVYTAPDFTSPFPFLRLRASWLFGQIISTSGESVHISGGLAFSSPAESSGFVGILPVAVLLKALEGMINCLQDPELPVRVQSAVDLRHFLDNPKVSKYVQPAVPHLLEKLFSLVDEVDHTDIISTIEAIIIRFSESVLPHSIQLCDKLTSAFLRASSSGEDEEEAGLVAVQCLQAIDTIMQSFAQHQPDSRTQVFAQIEKILSQIFNDMFDDSRMEYFEETLELLSTLLYYSNEDEGGTGISPYLWSLFPKIYVAFNDWAVDYAEKLVPPIDNYIALGTTVFYSGGQNNISHRQMLLNMIQKLWDLDMDDSDAEQGCKLAEIMILHAREGHRINDMFPALLGMCIDRLRTAESQKLRIMIITDINACFFYDASLTLQVLDQGLHCLTDVIALILSNVNTFKRIHDDKVAVLGLTSVLALAPDGLPAVLQNDAVYGNIVRAILSLLGSMLSKRKTRANEADTKAMANAFKLPDLPGVEANDDDDASNDEGEVALSGLTGRPGGGGLALGNWDDGWDSDEDEGDFESPIDDENETIFFAHILKAMPVDVASKIRGLLSEAEMTSINNIIAGT